MAHESSDNFAIVIMAGGAGERFWPVSNRKTPKQLLTLFGEKSLLAEAFERAEWVVPSDRVYIVASAELEPAIRNALPHLGERNYITEPFARNTAACLGLAACALQQIHGAGATMGVLTADHLIEDREAFTKCVTAAMKHASASEDLVTIGIKPTRAETGYGYLEVSSVQNDRDDGSGATAILPIKKFTEKPDSKTAEAFVRSGNYLWNSGMFFWKLESLFAAFESAQPQMAAEWQRLKNMASYPYPNNELTKIFEGLPSLPIDTAIMEKWPKISAVVGDFPWEDVGSWDSLARVVEADDCGNSVVGSATLMESKNNIIYNRSDEKEAIEQEIVLFGVDDLVVVRSEKAIMITRKSRAQDVKKIVRNLKESGRDDLL